MIVSQCHFGRGKSVVVSVHYKERGKMGESFPKILSPLLKLVDHVLFLRFHRIVYIIIRVITFERLKRGKRKE
jgi:hypothetical protein